MTGARRLRLTAWLLVIAPAWTLSACEPGPRDPRVPLSPLAVPLLPIEAPLESIPGALAGDPDGLRLLLERPEHAAADRIIAYAPNRRDSDFTEAGILDPVLRVRMGRMSRDSLEVDQALVVTPQGEILNRYVLSSIQGGPSGVLVVTR
jgi:hypothetical protein